VLVPVVVREEAEGGTDMGAGVPVVGREGRQGSRGWNTPLTATPALFPPPSPLRARQTALAAATATATAGLQLDAPGGRMRLLPLQAGRSSSSSSWTGLACAAG